MDHFLFSLAAINHRGPDGEGVMQFSTKATTHSLIVTPATPREIAYSSEKTEVPAPDLVMGHRRLGIIDTSVNGHQPMRWQHFTIIFNGEIYNYIEIREELKKNNIVFHTQSDTEVLIAAYATWGEHCLKKLNGMFSIVIYDERKKQLFVANDRFGVKPLYYYQTGEELCFVSETKQMYNYRKKLTLNQNVIKGFLDTAHIDTDEQTMFNEIKRVPKSHFAYISLNDYRADITFIPYYEIGTLAKGTPEGPEAFSTYFNDAIKIRLRSDVPLGFASSGGLDSTAILYRANKILREAGAQNKLNTFSAIFPGMDGDESQFIKFVEKDMQVDSSYCNPMEEFNIMDFERHIFHQDMPVYSTSNYAEWCVARMTSNAGIKVMLIGQGGDEILAGYHHHFYRYCRQLILQGKILKYVSLARQYAELKGWPMNDLHRKIINEVKLSIRFKTGLINISNPVAKRWNELDKLVDLLKYDLMVTMLPSYLRSDDRDGMAFSLETRHPFLDYRLVDFCFNLPDDVKIRDGWQKWILRKNMAEVPDTIRYRKDKKGYTTPEKLWINNNKKHFEEYLRYLPDQMKPESNKPVPFSHYALGVWLKVNKVKY